MTFWAAEVIDSGESRARRVRAWPKERSPDSTLCWIGSGKRNKRRKLATLARSLPVRVAICSWVSLKSWLSR